MRMALALRRSAEPSPASRGAADSAAAEALRSAAREASRAANQASVPAASGSHHWPRSEALSFLSLSYVSVRNATDASPTPASALSARESVIGKPHWSSPSRPPAPPASAPTTRLLFFKSTTICNIKRARRDKPDPPFVLSTSERAFATRSRKDSTNRFMPIGSSARVRGPATRRTPSVSVASSSLRRAVASVKKPHTTSLGNKPHTKRRASTAHKLDAARAFTSALFLCVCVSAFGALFDGSRIDPDPSRAPCVATPRASSSFRASAAPKRAPASGPSAPAIPATNVAMTAAYCDDARGPSTRAFRASSVAASPTARRGSEDASAATPETIENTLASPMRFIKPRTRRRAESASAAARASAFEAVSAIAARNAGGTYAFPEPPAPRRRDAAETPRRGSPSSASSSSSSASPSSSESSSSASSSAFMPIPNGSSSSSLSISSSLSSVIFGRRDALVAAAPSAVSRIRSGASSERASASSARSSRPGSDSKKPPSPSSGPFCRPLSRFKRRFCSASSRLYASSNAGLILGASRFGAIREASETSALFARFGSFFLSPASFLVVFREDDGARASTSDAEKTLFFARFPDSRGSSWSSTRPRLRTSAPRFASSRVFLPSPAPPPPPPSRALTRALRSPHCCLCNFSRSFASLRCCLRSRTVPRPPLPPRPPRPPSPRAPPGPSFSPRSLSSNPEERFSEAATSSSSRIPRGSVGPSFRKPRPPPRPRPRPPNRPIARSTRRAN